MQVQESIYLTKLYLRRLCDKTSGAKTKAKAQLYLDILYF
jgi:hypothetical protein